MSGTTSNMASGASAMVNHMMNNTYVKYGVIALAVIGAYFAVKYIVDEVA
jgi:hypothetical protein